MSSSSSSSSMPTPQQHQLPQQQPQQFAAVLDRKQSQQCTEVVAEDCRDYLRTGRCKYGSSCKYNHPLNVQNGGGMKAPLDPTEPLFPIRPHEPVCQYYMKHATCKFGQACKFHHPPQHAVLAAANAANSTIHGVMAGGGGGGSVVIGMGGTHVLMNVGGGRRMIDVGGAHAPPATQLILNPVGISTDGSSMMQMQLLPQRPDEPDCIYFLKNGRCKYGATCRYHHPVHYHQQQQQQRQQQQPRIVVDEQRQQRPTSSRQQQQGLSQSSSSSQQYQQQQQQQQQDPYSIPYVQYVTTHGPFPQGPVVMADGLPLTFVNVVDGSSQATTTTYKPVSLVPGGEGFPLYHATTGVGSTVATEQGSTTSSIASSYDTSGGNNSSSATALLDHHLTQGDTSSAALWNRAKKNRSGGSLNAHISSGGGVSGMATASSSARGTSTIPTVRSDGSIARRGRVGSYGSASDHGQQHFDANSGVTVASNTVRSSIAGNPEAAATVWRPDQRSSSSSFEQVRRMPVAAAAAGAHYVVETAEGQQQQPQSGQSHATALHHGRPPMRGGGGVAAAAQPRRTRHGTRSSGSSRSGDEGFTRMTSALLNMLDTPEETSADMYSDEGSYRYGFDEPGDATSRMFEGLSMAQDQYDDDDDDEHQHYRGGGPPPPPVPHPHDGDAAQWSPTWHGSAAGPGAAHHNNARTMSYAMMNHPSQQLPSSPNSEHSDFVGLYLP